MEDECHFSFCQEDLCNGGLAAPFNVTVLNFNGDLAFRVNITLLLVALLTTLIVSRVYGRKKIDKTRP